MKDYKSFNLIQKLYFERIQGTKDELSAAEIIVNECKSLGVKAKIEEFVVKNSKSKTAKLSFENSDFSPKVVSGRLSASTGKEGIEKEIVYITSMSDAIMQDIKDKICLMHGRPSYDFYKKLVEKEIAGLVICAGSIYNTDRQIFAHVGNPDIFDYSKIPVVFISTIDADYIVRNNLTKAKLINNQEHYDQTSRNVVAEIKGKVKPDEIVVFTAHYDSVKYSKGAYDNGSGSATIMQMLNHFKNNQPDRTVRFIWCGSEEIGLYGSRAYVEKHQDELKNIKLCVNVDMTGATIGTDYAVITAEKELMDYVKYMGFEKGFPIETQNRVYSSDSTPFAHKGVPAITFARLAPRNGAEIHSKKDIIENLSENNYYNTCDFIASFADRMVNAKYFPVSNNIPKELKEDLEKYFSRKETENKI